jgi:molybdate transport system substrate-binding protein
VIEIEVSLSTGDRDEQAPSALAVILFALTAIKVDASAAEIKCLCPNAFKGAFTEIVPQFEQSSAQKLAVSFATIGAQTGRVQNGEVADVVIVSASQIDALATQGKVVSGSRTGITRLGFGVFVQKGAAKPDVSSVEALKRT